MNTKSFLHFETNIHPKVSTKNIDGTVFKYLTVFFHNNRRSGKFAYLRLLTLLGTFNSLFVIHCRETTQLLDKDLIEDRWKVWSQWVNNKILQVLPKNKSLERFYEAHWTTEWEAATELCIQLLGWKKGEGCHYWVKSEQGFAEFTTVLKFSNKFQRKNA